MQLTMFEKAIHAPLAPERCSFPMPSYVIANEAAPFSPAVPAGTGLSPAPSAPSVAEATGAAGLGLDHVAGVVVLRGFVPAPAG